MKTANKLAKALFTACIALVFAGTGSAQTLKIPPHEKIVLKNGLTLLVMEKHGVPIVSFSAIVKTGSAADPAGQDGLATITAGLLRKGTQKRTAQQFASDLDFIGGSFDAGADTDYTTISAEFLTKDLDRGLDLFTDAVLHPAFPQGEVDKLLAQSIDGVKASKDEAEAVLGTYYAGYLYGTHPYGRPGGGDELTLKRIQRDAIMKFYSANYAPSNTILAVAGEFNPTELKKKLEDALGAWPAKPAPTTPIPAPSPVKGKRLLLVDKTDATQTYFEIGNVGISATDPDRVAIRVVNTAFGGTFASILNAALRIDSGYTYGAQSYFQPQKVAGPFAIASFTKNETTVPAIDLALKVLDDLHKNGLTAVQLDTAKKYMKGQFPPRIETSGQLAARIATSEFYGLDDNEINQLEARIDAVTLESAKQIIEKHFPKENMVFVLVGKAAEIRPAVKKYADQMDERKISEPGFWPPAK
ncbi:MAG TPA: pitrilysin family protein [Steroidobacteraceae bacterium]|nr:pitrilysin family protein [Steroidobacteraceae bacterium]